MIRNRNNVSSFITKDRSKIWELFHPSSSPANGFSVAEALVEPGQETDAHRHILSQEIYYILEGTGKMRVDKELSDVSAGDAVFMKPGMAHNVKNTGSGPLRILCVCCPPYSHEDTVLVKTQKI
jgi:mannose-6-phosphate isomerase-like protein (cupin superfamily)